MLFVCSVLHSQDSDTIILKLQCLSHSFRPYTAWIYAASQARDC